MPTSDSRGTPVYPPGPSSFFPSLVYRPGRNPLEFFSGLVKKYGPLVHLVAGTEHLYVVTEPRHVRDVLVTSQRKFKKGRGVQRLLDYTFYQVAAVNGYDSFGHYLRARLILNTCSRYYTTPVDGCLSKFSASAAQSSSATAASAGDTDPILRRTTAALQGKDPDSVAALPTLTATPQPTPAPVKKTAAPAPAATPAPANAKQGEAVLNYLFGKDAG